MSRKPYSPAVLLTLLVLFCPPPAFAQTRGVGVTTAPAFDEATWGTYHALIIGINDYREWAPLQTAVKDATALRDILVEQYGFDEKNVILRIDKDATRQQIIDDLRYLAGGLEKNDNLLIYYAGHGQLDDLTGDGYWIPVEGGLKSPSSWISNSILKGVLSSQKVRVKNVVVIADSCYSGSLLREGPSMLSVTEMDYQEKLARAAVLRSRQVISSGGVEPVADGGRDGHSLFAYYFLKALRDNERELIDLENLFHTKVWEPVTQIGDQRPNVGRLKTPMDEDGQFVLTNRALAQKLAAVKAAEADQASRQKSQLAALMAEKERLEAERHRLEVEQSLLDQRRQIEAERRRIEEARLNLEREKQQMALEAEKKKLEAERTGSKQTAPAPSMVAVIPPAVKDGKPFLFAVFPWQISLYRRISVGPFYDGCFKGISNAFRKFGDAQLAYSYYDSKRWGWKVKRIDDLFKAEDAKSLWKKTATYSKAEPDLDAISAFAGRIEADAVIMLYTDPGYGLGGLNYAGRGVVFLVDLRRKAVLKESIIDLDASPAKQIEERLDKLIANYLKR